MSNRDELGTDWWGDADVCPPCQPKVDKAIQKTKDFYMQVMKPE